MPLRDRTVEQPFDGWRAMRVTCTPNGEWYGATETGEPPDVLGNGFAELATVGVYTCTT